MKISKPQKSVIIWTVLVIIITILPACPGTKISGWSQQAYRSPEFNHSLLTQKRIAILPVIVLTYPTEKAPDQGSQSVEAPYAPQVPPSKPSKESPVNTNDAYRLTLSEVLLSKIQTKWSALNIVSPNDAVKRLSDGGLSATYSRFSQDFSHTGLDKDILNNFGSALNCRFLLISQAIVTEVKPEASVTFVWTFGRKQVQRSVKISAQIWDTQSGQQVWEGSGMGYSMLSAYESLPLMEELASQAVDNLISIMP